MANTNKPKKLKYTIKATKSVKSISRTNATKTQSLVRAWSGRIIASLLLFTYIMALGAVLHTDLTPTKYEVFIVPVSLLIVLAVVITCLRHSWKHLGKSILLGFCCVLVLLANGYIYAISRSASYFLANVESGEYSLEPYSFVTKKDYDVTVKKGASFGYLADDTNNTAVLVNIKDKTKALPKSSAELASLTVALDDKAVDSIVIRSLLLTLLEQNYPSFYQSLKVLDTFNIKTKVVSNTKKTDITKPYAVFLGGIDTYGDIAMVSRSDVNIVAVINPETHKVLLINTPRDYYVQLHSTTGVRDKLTHAGIYGIEMSRQTLEDLYQTPIDYSVRINFTSLLKIIDAIGGVRVYSDNAFTSGGYTFVKGYNNLNSKQALEFSRNRKSFENGDRTRGQNQQRVIESIVSKVNDPRSLLKYQTIVKSLGDSFQTNATKEEVAALLKQQMNTLGSWNVESISVDGTDSHNATYSMGAQQLYVMEPNVESVNAARAKIQDYIK